MVKMWLETVQYRWYIDHYILLPQQRCYEFWGPTIVTIQFLLYLLFRRKCDTLSYWAESEFPQKFLLKSRTGRIFRKNIATYLLSFCTQVLTVGNHQRQGKVGKMELVLTKHSSCLIQWYSVQVQVLNSVGLMCARAEDITWIFSRVKGSFLFTAEVDLAERVKGNLPLSLPLLCQTTATNLKLVFISWDKLHWGQYKKGRDKFGRPNVAVCLGEMTEEKRRCSAFAILMAEEGIVLFFVS